MSAMATQLLIGQVGEQLENKKSDRSVVCSTVCKLAESAPVTQGSGFLPRAPY